MHTKYLLRDRNMTSFVVTVTKGNKYVPIHQRQNLLFNAPKLRKAMTNFYIRAKTADPRLV